MKNKKILEELSDYREAQRKIWESTKDDYHIGKIVDSVIGRNVNGS